MSDGQTPLPDRRFYAPELDGLRFVAALLVFVHHLPPIPYLEIVKNYGWAGVDLFLTLSAFLITRLIIIEYEANGSFDIQSFFIRRALRIWPLLFCYVTLLSLYAVLAGAVGGQVGLAWWLGHVSFTNNVMTAIHGFSPVPYTAHLWTISLEEQAYVVMPLLILAFLVTGANRTKAIWLSVAAIAVMMVARTALVLLDTPHPVISVLPIRGDAFIAGALGAIIFRKPVQSAISALAIGGLSLIAILVFRNIDVAGPGQIVGYSLIAFGCISIVLGVQAYPPAKSLLSNRVIGYLGKISYGIYVYHLIAIDVADRLGLGAYATAVIGLALAVAIAALSYSVLERPFLVLKERFARVESRPV